MEADGRHKTCSTVLYADNNSSHEYKRRKEHDAPAVRECYHIDKMNFYVFTLACCLVAASALPADDQDWEFYKLKFNKKYFSDREQKNRKAVFLKNRQDILDHNARYQAGLVGHSAGINHFSDFEEEEFQSYTSCLIKGTNYQASNITSKVYNGSDVDFTTLPKNFDWREKGAVTDVKDQGRCGSCWAFSTTGTLEGTHFLETGKLVSLSEQNILDCDRTSTSQGCQGGYMEEALKHIVKDGGIDTEASYPYMEEYTNDHPVRQCKYTQRNKGASIKEVYKVENSMEVLMAAVVTKGPIAIGVSVGNPWMTYMKGVLTSKICYEKNEINHGVLLVGYGETDKGVKYWLVKNSWGTFWGENGYIKVRRGYGFDCGITSEPVFSQ